MKRREKILLCILPAFIGGVSALALVYPKVQESEQKSAQVKSRKAELDQLQVRLNQGSKAEQDKRLLESEISALRSSVPKSPELDLMMLDMEKMCTACDVGLIAVENPSSDILRQLQTAAKEQEKAKAQPVANANSKIKAPGKPANVVEEAALKSVVKQVFVTGDYGGLVAFMKMLESYQRIVGVSQIAVAVKSDNEDTHNASSERADKLKLKQPIMSFLLTLYYLP